jgi:hypothetical protein
MKKQKQYTVIWRNELFATSKQDAVEQCLDMIKSNKTVFEIAKGVQGLKELSKLEPLQMIEL